MKKTEKFAEFEIHDHAMETIYGEIKEIKRKRARTDEDIARMEKLVRMYTTLMGSLRENIKDGLRDKLIPEGEQDGPENSNDDSNH